MAHKKGLGSSRNGRDSNAQRLGVKVFAGQVVNGGGPARARGERRARVNRRLSADARLALTAARRAARESR